MDIVGAKRKWFSVIVGLYPLLSVYRSPIPSVDLGTIMLLFLFFFISKMNYNKTELNPLIIYILVFTPLVLVTTMSFNVPVNTIVVRYGKMIITLFIVFVFGARGNFYDERITIKTVRTIVYICAAFVIVQRIVNMFGTVLSNPFLHFAMDEAYDIQQSYSADKIIRFSGLFLEPSHMAMYYLPYLCYTLFENENLKGAIFTTAALLCTGSGIGIVSSLCLFIVYIFLKLRKNLIFTLAFVLFFIVSIMCISRWQFIQYSIMRFTTANVENGGNAIQARVGVGYELFLNNSLAVKIFGYGYGNIYPNVYCNGFAYTLNTLGVLGTGLFIIAMIKNAVAGKAWKRIGIGVLFGLSFFSQTFTPALIVYFMCLYSSRIKNKHLTIEKSMI